MSRWLEEIDGQYAETLADPDRCRFMLNDLCCYKPSDYVGSYPTEEECEGCPYFRKETMEEGEEIWRSRTES